MTEAISTIMTLEKETKNAVRYQEKAHEDGSAPYLETMYVKKTAFANGKVPAEIAVSITYNS